MVGTSAVVAFLARKASTARRSAGTVRTTMGLRDIWVRSLLVPGGMLGERGDLGLASCGRCGDLTKARPSPPRRPARRKGWQLDGALTDWIVVRNRLSKIGSRNKQLVASGLKDLSLPLGFRAIDALPSAWCIASSSRAD